MRRFNQEKLPGLMEFINESFLDSSKWIVLSFLGSSNFDDREKQFVYCFPKFAHEDYWGYQSRLEHFAKRELNRIADKGVINHDSIDKFVYSIYDEKPII
jgi:hypothetical protein